MPEEIVLKFTKLDETKGTFRYQEDGSEVVGRLYIKKDAAKKLGDKITVTIKGE
jgi:hypothetical protein